MNELSDACERVALELDHEDGRRWYFFHLIDSVKGRWMFVRDFD
jgi:hypothetical protein